MKAIQILILLILFSLTAQAQIDDCATPNLDSAFAVSLPYFDNTELLESTLQQDGYYNLEQIAFPSLPQLNAHTRIIKL